MAADSHKRTYILLGAVLGLLIFLNAIGWLDVIKNPIRSIFMPFFAKANNISISVGENYEFFKSRENFFSAYRDCRSSLENRAIDDSRVKVLEDDNSSLREILKFRERIKYSLVVARVIGQNIEKIDQTILIDRGAEEGIKTGQPVVVGNGMLIGKIVRAEKGMSIVRLINDNQSKIAATVLNAEKSLGVVEGGYGLSVKMNFIPRNETLRIGDQIITSGLEDLIPRGLLIGSVTAIENETYRPFQAALLAPGTDLSKLSIIAVLTSSQVE